MDSFGTQVLMGFEGTDPDDPVVQRVQSSLRQRLIGGVILFQKNIQNPSQGGELIQSLKEAAAPHQAWIAVDQEGGAVQRLKTENGFQEFPSAQDIAATFSPSEAKKIYGNLAAELAQTGFNLNFGPVVDLATHPTAGSFCPVIGGKRRSYGSSLETILPYAQAFVEAHRAHSVATALKHYPGHGLALLDSHAEAVDITDTHIDLEEQPFRQMAARGAADMIMVAHLHHRKWDPQHPASLSRPILKRLRSFYDGVIVSDDLHMGAIINHYPLEDILRLALGAGNDLLIFSENPMASNHSPFLQDALAQAETLHATVDQLIKNDILDENCLIESQARLKRLQHP